MKKLFVGLSSIFICTSALADTTITGKALSSYPVKSTPQSADKVLIVDSSAANASKLVAIGSIWSALAAYYQPLDPDLTIWAGVTPGSGVASALRNAVDSAGGFVTYDSDLISAKGASSAGASKYWGTNSSGTVGFYTLPSGGTGTVDLSAPGPIGGTTPNTGTFTAVVASSYSTSVADGGRYARPFNSVAIAAPADIGGFAWYSDRFWIANGSNWTTRYFLDSSMLGTAGGAAKKIASGTATLGASSISSGACATVVTVSATGVTTTDVVSPGWQGDPSAVTGYIPSTSGGLIIYPYPTANNVNFKVCNPTASSITPGALTINWQVLR